MLNRRRFLKNLLGAGAALTCTPALAALQEAGQLTREPRNTMEDKTHQADDIWSKHSQYYNYWIVKVREIRSIAYYDHSMQINVNCLGLDDCLNVFKVELVIFPETKEERDSALATFAIDSIVAVRGSISILDDGQDITIYPTYPDQCWEVEPELANELRKYCFKD